MRVARLAAGYLASGWLGVIACVRHHACLCGECALVLPRAISFYHVPTVGQRMAWIPPLYRRVRLSDDGKVRSQVLLGWPISRCHMWERPSRRGTDGFLAAVVWFVVSRVEQQLRKRARAYSAKK